MIIAVGFACLMVRSFLVCLLLMATASAQNGQTNTRLFGLGNLAGGALAPAGGALGGLLGGQQGFGQQAQVGIGGQQGFGQQVFGQQGLVGQIGGIEGVSPDIQQQGIHTCRRWCRTPQGQAYCCVDGNEPPPAAIIKQGQCPTFRPSCPPKRGFAPPKQCSSDGGCAGFDKCCFDPCLQHQTCKSPTVNNTQLFGLGNLAGGALASADGALGGLLGGQQGFRGGQQGFRQQGFRPQVGFGGQQGFGQQVFGRQCLAGQIGGCDVSTRPPKPPGSCDCHYKLHGFFQPGCVILDRAPDNYACFCSISGLTCPGKVVECVNPDSEACKRPTKNYASCLQGGGNCASY